MILALAAAGSFSMILAGDIMLNGVSPSQHALRDLAPLVRPASVAIANLEIPLTDATVSTPFKSSTELAARTQYILKADPGNAAEIPGAGFDMVSLGNNHCLDYRAAGMNQMQGLLRKFGVLYAGAGMNRDAALRIAVYRTNDGTRVGLLSALAFMNTGGLAHCTPATATRAGVATFDFGGKIGSPARQFLAGLIGSAKRQCDVLVVGLHWGIERQTVPTQYQVDLGRACIDSGADVVWGNHPHVLQGGELYRGRPILYSMGNLVTSRGGSTGLAKLVYAGGAFQRAYFFPCEIGSGSVRPVSGAEAASRVRSYIGLCNAIQRHYPSPYSRSLFAKGR